MIVHDKDNTDQPQQREQTAIDTKPSIKGMTHNRHEQNAELDLVLTNQASPHDENEDSARFDREQRKDEREELEENFSEPKTCEHGV